LIFIIITTYWFPFLLWCIIIIIGSLKEPHSQANSDSRQEECEKKKLERIFLKRAFYWKTCIRFYPYLRAATICKCASVSWEAGIEPKQEVNSDKHKNGYISTDRISELLAHLTCIDYTINHWRIVNKANKKLGRHNFWIFWLPKTD
jgi:hypothetical protein